MTLSSMIVSGDWQEVSVLECILSGFHIDVSVETDSQRAWTTLVKTKVDALIVDCDMEGAGGLFHKLSSGLNSVPVVIASGSMSRKKLEMTGAAFVVEKPVSVEKAVHTLSAARNMILDGRLRYFRQDLTLPVVISYASGKRTHAQIVNLSQGGTKIRSRKPLPFAENVGLRFALPGTDATLDVDGIIAWSDKQGNSGIRFARVGDRVKRNLQLWLEQRFFDAPAVTI